jgi:hypothetical protein
MNVCKKIMFVSLSAHMFCLAILLSSISQEQSVDVVRKRVRPQHTYEHFYLERTEYQYNYIGFLCNGNIKRETEN